MQQLLGDSALFMHYSCTIYHCLRTVHRPTITLFRKKYIKNGSHDTIHTFKNYFNTMFSVFSKISCIQTDPKCIELKDKTSYKWDIINDVVK